MKTEDEFPDVLQNIEHAVVQFYRANPELTDHVVLRVYEALGQTYEAERSGRTPRGWNPAEMDAALCGEVKAVCEWRLGRNPDGPDLDDGDLVDAEAMARCFKRLAKSVRLWTSNAGRRGYLAYVSRFIP
jgi:hypothetical protein